MNTKTISLSLASALALAGCSTMDGAEPRELAMANLSNSSGQPVGTATLVDYGTSRAMRVMVTGIPAGPHGFHLHTTGTCTPPDFQSAGGHLNPEDNEHGRLNPDGKHLGDLLNIDVPASGTLTTEVPVDGTPDYLMEELFDADGTAVMIHSGADDYRTNPSGDAGSRIACGVLTRA
ncbi:superoxide dismutase family protein [Erythrobacter litoralis]|uniref:superoxide dismutase family protein n=1 Tax=Erythrobacter litoralis TaxID=39960 RepID=UPI002435023D|nr:superoxide dismutase family protein [Erythrobacter litoralis]MDG6079998.1 superoxide dismutase family protein [Erythrobacter litoralis]